MIDILSGGVLPIFAIGVIGYILARRGIFDFAMASAINRFVFYVGVPCLGFRLIARAPLEDFDLTLLAGFFASEAVMYGAGFAIGRYLFKAEIREAILLGMATAFTNHLLFALPIAILLFGEATAAPIVAIITVDTILLFSGTLIVMDFMSTPSGAARQAASKIMRNPPVISALAGLIVNLADMEIPAGADVFLEFAGGAAAPSALFALGIVLAQRQEPGRAMLPVTLSAMKLILHPLIAWLALIVLIDIPPATVAPVMMVAAAPCGAMAFVMAMNYQVRVNAIARAILYSSIGSLLTITLAAGL